MASSGPTGEVEQGAAARLSRERIVEAAIGLVDRDGPDALSMRSLAGELGVGTMTLYHHVSSKDDVRGGIAAVVLEWIDLPDPTGRS